MKWYIPCASGDFRLAALEANTCRLVIMNPTDAEREQLRRFVVEARSRGWLDPAEGFALQGRTTLTLSVPVTEAAPVLAPEVLGGATAPWTAVRSTAGKVELLKGRTVVQAAQEVADKVAETTAAVTLRPPHLGCPAPLPANPRASEVLRAFSTRRQMQEWATYGRMTVYGNASGMPYHVWHRNEAHRRRLGHTVTLAQTGEEVCAWDDSVPAEEEALACKLALEHAEEHMHIGDATAVYPARR